MNRKPELDWWPKPPDAPKVSLPSTDEELRELADEMADEFEADNLQQQRVEFMSKSRTQQQFIPAPNPPDLLGDLAAATAITLTLRPAVFLQLKQHMKLLQMSDEIMLSMRGGDLWLMKDRLQKTPLMVTRGSKPWFQHKVKGSKNGR